MKKLILFLFILIPCIGQAEGDPLAEVRDQIIRAVDPWTLGIRKGHAARPFANQIINGLYLGNDEKFAETVGFPCRTNDKKWIDTSNPNRFETIISLCTYARMVKEMPDLKTMDLEEVEQQFQKRGITWWQLGCSLPDDKKAWTDLVYNATFPDSSLAKKDLGIPKKSKQPEHVKLREEKKRKVESLPVDQWFEPTFKVLDEAVHSGKKTLVHCHAGASRSPTLIAAYLIKRYGVSAKQAISFLRSKRNCSNPKCEKDLKRYAEKLQALKEKD